MNGGKKGRMGWQKRGVSVTQRRREGAGNLIHPTKELTMANDDWRAMELSQIELKVGVL